MEFAIGTDKYGSNAGPATSYEVTPLSGFGHRAVPRRHRCLRRRPADRALLGQGTGSPTACGRPLLSHESHRTDRWLPHRQILGPDRQPAQPLPAQRSCRFHRVGDDGAGDCALGAVRRGSPGSQLLERHLLPTLSPRFMTSKSQARPRKMTASSPSSEWLTPQAGSSGQ